MKKILLLAFCLFLSVVHLFAITNIGEYSTEEVGSTLCADLFSYMNNHGLLDDFAYYKFHINSSNWWQFTLFEEHCNQGLAIIFLDDSITLLRYCDEDYSNTPKEAVLSAINSFASNYPGWQSFCYDEIEPLSSIRKISTKGLSLKTLADQVRLFNAATLLGFETIAAECGVSANT